jgi:hypothetical protein
MDLSNARAAPNNLGTPPPTRILRDNTPPALALTTNLPTTTSHATMETPTQPFPPQPQTLPPPEQMPEEENDSEGGNESGGEGESDSEEEYPAYPWQPIEVVSPELHDDELQYIKSKPELNINALDEKYWQEAVFLDLDDPEIGIVADGKIDWVIEGFNGTRENPNNERVMRSAIVKIGGYDWQIKLYPRGDIPGSEYPALYVECLTMQSPEWEEHEEWEAPPFPLFKGKDNSSIKKRRSVAVQLAVVMYNPAEPRTFEHRIESHQFHKNLASCGWPYFSHYPRSAMSTRRHGQRQAMLADDKLAFRAYIRVLDDPTGCLWDNLKRLTPDEITWATGLRPFTRSLSYMAVALPLLHFGPFREFVKSLRGPNVLREWFQVLLIKLYTRARSNNFGQPGRVQHDGDAMEMLWKIRFAMSEAYPVEEDVPTKFKELVGAFHPEHGTASGPNRLNTKQYPSIQSAVDNHKKFIDCPQLLTLELTRHEHDKTQRKWIKVTNKVDVSNQLTVNGVDYTLFAFVTHCGPLQSHRYHSYIRPRGPGSLWTAFHDGRVSRLTEKQARCKHSGPEKKMQQQATRNADGSDPAEDGYDSPFAEFHQPLGEVTCIVMYVRNDVAPQTFNFEREEEWIADLNTDPLPEMKTAIHEHFDHGTGLRDLVAVEGSDMEMRIDRVTAEVKNMSKENRKEITDIASQLQALAAVPTPSPSPASRPVLKSRESVEHMQLDKLDKGTMDFLGRCYYEGELNSDNKFQGGGHLIDLNGDDYLGEFHNDLYHGWGRLIFANTGDVYEGEWVEGRQHGEGKLTEASSGNVYLGGYVEGRQSGKFTYSGTITDQDKNLCRICYDQPINCAFYDCGHTAVCRQCAENCKECPMCRRQIMARLQLYGCNIQLA